MGESLLAKLALKGFVSRVNPHVLLQVMLELESLSTIGAFESSQDSRLIVADHMSLKSVDVCKVLLAHLAPHRFLLRVRSKVSLVHGFLVGVRFRCDCLRGGSF